MNEEELKELLKMICDYIQQEEYDSRSSRNHEYREQLERVFKDVKWYQ